MKKTIAIVSAFAFALSAQFAFAGNVLHLLDNSTDDGVFAFKQISTSFMGIQLNQAAFVEEDIEVEIDAGDNHVTAGEDIEEGDITVEGGNEMDVSLGTSVHDVSIDLCGCAGGPGDNETLVEGNLGDDPLYAGDQETNDATLLEVNSFEDVNTDIEVEIETGDNSSDAGEDNVGSDIVVGPSFLKLFRVMSVGSISIF